MAGNPFFQNLDPAAAPPPVTPSGGHGDDAGWAKVTPVTDSPAPYDISAPQDIAGIAAAAAAARELAGGAEGTDTGAGFGNVASPRQAQTEAILDSPQGADSSNVFAGFPDYENQDLRPAGELPTPIQGEMGAYPVENTYQPGLPQFMAGLGGDAPGSVPGVPPEGGSVGPSKGMDYPGTTQDGLTKYGTS